MKRSSTLFLRLVIALLGAAVLALCVFVLPSGILSPHTAWNGYKPILIGMYIPAIPFFIGLYQAWRLLNLIDGNKAFSKMSIQALKTIKYCGFIISVLYAAGLPYIFTVAERDDAPGVVLIGFIFTGGPFVIGTAAAIFQKMFQDAVEIKDENELTV